MVVELIFDELDVQIEDFLYYLLTISKTRDFPRPLQKKEERD